MWHLLKRSALVLTLAGLIVIGHEAFGDQRSSNETHIAAKIPVDRGYVGYVIRYETGENSDGRIRVKGVHPASPASKAGLQDGDLILTIDGKSFSFANDLEMTRALNEIKAGELVKLELLRNGAKLVKTVMPTAMSDDQRESLAGWIEAAERWYEGGEGARCRERRNTSDESSGS